MFKPITVTIVLSAATAMISSVGFAHVKNGALVDGKGNPISSGYEKCVRVSSGKFSSKCHDIKAKAVAQPAPAPAPKPITVQETVSRTVSLEGDVSFARGGSGLNDTARQTLDSVADSLNELSDYTVALEGHTDSTGSDAYNQTLSEERAQSAADYLISQGVPANTISTRGWGETRPVASNDTPEGRAQNRRVDVIINGTKTTHTTPQ